MHDETLGWGEDMGKHDPKMCVLAAALSFLLVLPSGALAYGLESGAETSDFDTDQIDETLSEEPFEGVDGAEKEELPEDGGNDLGFELESRSEQFDSLDPVEVGSDFGDEIQQEKDRSIPDGVYVLSLVNSSGLVLDVESGSLSSGANVQLWEENKTPAQRFSVAYDGEGYYEIVGIRSGMALDAADDGSGNVRQWTRTGQDSQKWVMSLQGDGSYVLSSKVGGAYLSSTDGGAGSNVFVGAEDVEDALHVVFCSIESERTVSDGEYVLASALGGRYVLDIAGASSANSANAQLYASNMTNAQRFRVAFDEGTGYYSIQSVSSGKMLDVSGGRSANGTNVAQHESNGTYAQKWVILPGSEGTFEIRTALSDCKSLDVQWGSASNGSNVWIYDSNASLAQRFFLVSTAPSVASTRTVPDGVYVIHSRIDNQKVMDISGASRSNGANAWLYAANGTTAQRFQIMYDERGFYSIRAISSGAALDVADGNMVPGANVQQWDYSADNVNQRWAISVNADGTCKIISQATGLVLDISGGSSANGANIQTWVDNGTVAQSFSLESVDVIPEGCYTLLSSVSSSEVVDMQGASLSSGANAQLWGRNDTLAQKFWINNGPDGSVSLQSLRSGMYLTETSGNVCQMPAEVGDDNLSQRWIPQLSDSGMGLVFVNAASGMALDVVGGFSSGANIGTSEVGGASSQRFFAVSVDPLSADTYTIVSAADERVLDVYGGSAANGANVQLWSSNNTGAQKWIVRSVGSGYVSILNARSRKALDVHNYGSVPGTNVQQWQSSEGNTAQLFKPVPTGDGFFYLESACSGLYVGVEEAGFDGANVQLCSPSSSSAVKFRFDTTSYEFTIDDVRSGINSASGSWNITSFGGYEMSSGVYDKLLLAVNNIRWSGYDVGVVMIDITTGQGVACNPDAEFYSASTIKGPYVASVASVYPSSVWSWSNTMYPTINVSSNEGYASLRTAFGSFPMSVWMAEAGVDASKASTWYPCYSAKDLAKLWTCNYEFFTSEPNGWISQWYSSPYNSMIYQNLGSYYTTWTKPGWIASGSFVASNDAGIVWAGDRPYAVAILTSVPSRLYYLNDVVWALEAAHSEMV